MPARRATDNGWLKYIPWAVVFALVGVAVVAGETRMQVRNNKENLSVHEKLGAKVQGAINERLRQQSEINGRIDERTQAIQRQLSTIIRELRKP